MAGARILLALAVAFAALDAAHATIDGCTAIAVGRKATTDGSLYTVS